MLHKLTERLLCGCLALSLTIPLAGCSVKNASALIRQAKHNYGDCEVIRQSETDDKTTVVLRDKLQGFEYEMSSGMQSVHIDGASFGSLEDTNCSFSAALCSYVSAETLNARKAVCEKYGLTFDEEALLEVAIDDASQKPDGICAVEEIAAILNGYNLEHRLDGWKIDLVYSEAWLHHYYSERLAENGGDIDDDPVFSSAGGAVLCHIGSVKLPDSAFRDRAQEEEDYYLEMAQMQNPKAVFVRKETRAFAETGISPDRVIDSLDYSISTPKSPSDPVVFYYYEVNGREFYICDFLDAETNTWHTNYKDVF